MKEILSERREDIPLILSTSRIDENRRQGEYLLGHRSQSRSSLSKNFGSPAAQETKGLEA